MTAPRVRPAFLVWLLAMLVIAVSGWILLPFPRRPTGWEEIVWTIGFGMGFATVGAILVDRRPNEPVSRLTLAIGLMVVAAVGFRALAVALDSRPGELPAVGALAALTAQALQLLAFMTAGGFLLVRFPSGAEDGRLTSAVNLLFALSAIAIVLGLFVPGPIGIDWVSATRNPIGVDLVDLGPISGVANVAILGYAVGLGLAIVVIVRRYRRSGHVVRTQIRWVAAAGVAPVILFPLLYAWDWMWSLWFLSTALLPIAIGIAILRYRLYDIDRVIGRTLSYAIVTAVLGGVFVGTNLALQAAVAGAARGNSLTVAASTLLVAALFQPVRYRVQALINRRFNRAHLDAERVVGSFARQARDEIDLGHLRTAVVGVVVEAVRPDGAAVWLRAEGPAGSAGSGRSVAPRP